MATHKFEAISKKTHFENNLISYLFEVLSSQSNQPLSLTILRFDILYFKDKPNNIIKMSQATLAFDLDFFYFNPHNLISFFYSTFLVAMRVQKRGYRQTKPL